MTIFQLPTKEQLKPLVDFLAKYRDEQEKFTRGTRQNSQEGWTSMTLEWGKRDRNNQQMISLESALQAHFPNDVLAVGGAVRLLEIAAQVTGEFRIVPREATWTPKRGRNAGRAQVGQLHDVFFTQGAGQQRQLFNPFEQDGATPIGTMNPSPGQNPAQAPPEGRTAVAESAAAGSTVGTAAEPPQGS